jgi:hypothetical protein
VSPHLIKHPKHMGRRLMTPPGMVFDSGMTTKVQGTSDGEEVRGAS